MKTGLFITLEGCEGSGKTTHSLLLAKTLTKKGFSVLRTREPGGTSLAESIRKLLLRPGSKISPLTELFLYEAARAQHTREKILPALKRGLWVLCERYSLATMAYQGYARRLPRTMIRTLDRIATRGLKPDLAIILDIPESEFSRRDAKRKLDRLELESEHFRRRVREGYRQLARSEKDCALVNGRLPLAEVHKKIVRLVERLHS